MKKPLHLAASMEELNKQTKVTVDPRKVKLFLTSLPKLFSQAEVKRKEDDEEHAYVCYMKFIGVAQAIMQTSEYKADKKYHDAMIDLGKMAKAMNFCEALSQSLSARYQDKISSANKKKALEEEKQLAKKVAALELKEKPKEGGDQAENTAELGYQIMEPKQLYSLITERATSFLILDTRPGDDYAATHIKHPYSMSIPETILVAGSTAKALEKNIKLEFRSQWNKRSTTDKIILLDWTSKKIEPRSHLEVLRDSMYKWERSGYLCKTPYLLMGGFENFSIRYPLEVTDPNKARTLAKSRLSSAAKLIAPNLADVNYPDPSILDNGFLVTPSPSPKSASTKVEPNSTGSWAEVKPPVPDRGSKPKTRPTKIDDTSDDTTWSQDSNSDGQAAHLNDGFMDSQSHEIGEDSSSKVSPPRIDRSLKAKALLTQGSNKGKMAEVLEAERDLAEESVQMEKQELEMEQQWVMLRLKREKEAEEDMKEEMMKSEEALLEKMNRLVEDKKRRDVEYDDLRIQLNTLKAQLDLKSSTAKNVEEELIEKKVRETIRQRDRERRKLQTEVEEKRTERKLKQREQLVEAHRRQQHEKAERERRLVEAENARNQAETAMREKETAGAAARARRGGGIFQPLKDDSATSSFGDLSRSHSSPNIAQMLEEEDRLATSNIPTPRFDRNVKPSVTSFNQARARNFQPVWGTGKKGLTGLKNLGNTCYMNSILQCLSNFTAPAQYFIDRIFQRDLNNNSETKGEVAVEFSEVIRALWSGQYKSIAPGDLKRVVGRHMEAFRGSSQQDAHEFLTKLMDWLNSDLNEVRFKVSLPPEPDYNKMAERAAADEAWEMQKRVEKSFIQETFFGQTRSTCQCQSCGFRSFKFEKFLGLTLNLPSGGSKWTLDQCIQDMLREESIEYVCEKCNQRSKKATKRLEIVRMPLILTIHFKRFYKDYDIDVWRKKPNFVDFPLTDFDAGRYAAACGGQLNRYRNYQLYGVCNHFGSMEGGHYTAFCYSQVYGKWHKYDDHEVTSMKDSDVRTPAAYILFYSAKN